MSQKALHERAQSELVLIDDNVKILGDSGHAVDREGTHHHVGMPAAASFCAILARMSPAAPAGVLLEHRDLKRHFAFTESHLQNVRYKDLLSTTFTYTPEPGPIPGGRVPRPKKVIAILREVGEILRRSRHLPMQAAVAQVNPVLRGWVNYFRVGNSGRAFDKVKYEVDHKVRRLAAKKCKRKGFGWKRWSSAVVYGTWASFETTALCTGARKHAPAERTHNPDGRRLRGEP